MSAGHHADVPTHTGIVTGEKIERRVTHVRYPLNAARAGGLHRVEDQIRRGTTLRHVVTAYDSVKEFAAPPQRVEQQRRRLAVKTGIQSHPNTALAECLEG